MLDMNVVILDFGRSQPYSFNSLSYCSNLISRILNVATLFYLHLSILIYTYPFELGCDLLVSCSSFIVVYSVSGQSPTGIIDTAGINYRHIRKPSLTDRIVSINKCNRVPRFCFHHSQCFVSPSIKGIQHDKVAYTIFFYMYVCSFVHCRHSCYPNEGENVADPGQNLVRLFFYSD